MKFHHERYLGSIISLLLLATQISGQNICTSQQISNVDVSGCSCPSNFPTPPSNLICATNSNTCSFTCQPPPPISPLTSRAELTQCGSGCVDANNDCNGCYIWFHSLCGCIRDRQAGGMDCIFAFGPPGSPAWVVLTNGDLITSTLLIPGILQLATAADPDGGFRLGQNTLRNGHAGQQYSRATGTLAMNSVITRSEEQIHIHLCNHPNSGVRGILNGLTRDNYRILKSVDISSLGKSNAGMWCRVSPNKGEDVNVARDVLDFLGRVANTCAQDLVGAGVVTDVNDYSWSCVTTNQRAAETLFCSD